MQFKRKVNKTRRTVIFLSALAVLIALLTVLAVILSRSVAEVEVPKEEGKVLKPIREEEGRFNSYPIAYPLIDQKDITLVSIENENGSYFMAIPPDGSSDSFEFFYEVDDDGNYAYIDEQGRKYVYYSPDILTEEDEMRYDELYAKVKGDGYDRIPMLTYLLAALRSPYFDDRIYLSDDVATRERQLAAYGFSTGTATEMPEEGEEESDAKKGYSQKIVRFTYTKEDGTEGSYKIEIGNNTVTGSGYYFRVYDAVYDEKGNAEYRARDYLYVTRESNYFKYALVGIEAYINPILVAAGLENDQHALYAPYLTPEYKQWKTELHELGSLPSDKEGMKNVTDVFATVNTWSPIFVADNEDVSIYNNYVNDILGSYIFNMTEYEDNALYSYLLSALSGKELGGGSVSQSLLYERDVMSGKKYRYWIKSVDAIITGSGDNTTAGATVSEFGARYVRVTYALGEWNEEKGEYVQVENLTQIITGEDGKTELNKYATDTCGIIDLNYLKKIGVAEDTLNRLTTVEKFEVPLFIDVTYEKKIDGVSTGLSSSSMSYYLDAVLEIYSTVRDEDGNVVSYTKASSLTDTSIVAFRYYYVKDGKAQNANIGYIDMLSDENEKDHEKQSKIRAAIKVWMNLESEQAINVLDESVYKDIVSDYILYEFENISAYITGELVSSFRFVNSSERDPFYGESFYESADEFMLYAVNQDSCEKVTKLLGGLVESSSVDGLTGIETVELGVTFASMKKWGCTANLIHYSLPRDLYVSVETAENEFDDYGWLRTLDFVLYVSDSVWDPDTESYVRYVASEMYDIIVKISADVLGFLDLERVDFWARRNFILVDSTYLKSVGVELKMSDISGKFDLFIRHDDIDVGSATDYDFMRVHLEKIEANFRTRYDEYLEYLAAQDSNAIGPYLSDFYDYLAGEQVSEDNDSKGTGMFKEWLLALYFTSYSGTLTEEEQAQAKAGGLIMSLDIMLDGDRIAKDHAGLDASDYANKHYYYKFYRCDDNRVMVSISNSRFEAGSSDFYISDFAFNKIVSNFIGLLNGETLDSNEPYPDFKPLG